MLLGNTPITVLQELSTHPLRPERSDLKEVHTSGTPKPMYFVFELYIMQYAYDELKRLNTEYSTTYDYVSYRMHSLSRSGAEYRVMTYGSYC